MRSPNSFSSGRSSRNALPYVAADVLAVDEHARVGAQRVADAEHHRFEERPALGVERPGPCSTTGSAELAVEVAARTARIEHFDVDARLLVREDAAAASGRTVRPRRLDHGARLRFDQRPASCFNRVEIAARSMIPSRFEPLPRRSRSDRVATSIRRARGRRSPARSAAGSPTTACGSRPR